MSRDCFFTLAETIGSRLRQRVMARGLVLFLSLLPFTSMAQEIETIAGIRIVFSTAGARSTGMGRVSTLAGDTAASISNPAALAGTREQLSIEARRTSRESRYFTNSALDTTTHEFTSSAIGSVVVASNFYGATWALSYDEPLQEMRPADHAGMSRTTVPVRNGVPDPGCRVCPTLEFRVPTSPNAPSSLRLRRYGAAMAKSVGGISVGASARLEDFRQDSSSSPFPGVRETSDDHAVTWTAGVLWMPASPLRLGASYASGARFGSIRHLPQNPDPWPRLVSTEFRTPSSIRAGFEVTPFRSVTLAADAVRIRYSEMMHERRELFAGRPLSSPDVTEWHVGAEYRVGAVALRGGWWLDPAHRIDTGGAVPPSGLTEIILVPDEDENHFTLGIGVGRRVRFDAAIDRGSRGTAALIGIAVLR